MDEETRAALDLTGEELRAMRDAGEPGVVAKRPRDLNQRAKFIVDKAVARFEERQDAEGAWVLTVPPASEQGVTIEGLTVEPGFREEDRFLSVGHPSITVR